MNNTKQREHFAFILKNAEDMLHSKCTPAAKRDAGRAAMAAKAELANLDRLDAAQSFIANAVTKPAPSKPSPHPVARKADPTLTARDRRQIAEFEKNGGRDA
jgi:hypothetical protein